MSLADMLNSPTEVEFEGKTYRLRQPTLVEMGEFQRWLEQRAYDAIERRTYQDPAQQDRDRRNLNNDVAAGVFEWGSEVAAAACQTPAGITRVFQLILRDQGLSAEAVRRMIDLKLRELTAIVISKRHSDPNSLRAVLATLGLPEDFFSSNSPTHPSTSGSTTSEG